MRKAVTSATTGVPFEYGKPSVVTAFADACEFGQVPDSFTSEERKGELSVYRVEETDNLVSKCAETKEEGRVTEIATSTPLLNCSRVELQSFRRLNRPARLKYAFDRLFRLSLRWKTFTAACWFRMWFLRWNRETKKRRCAFDILFRLSLRWMNMDQTSIKLFAVCKILCTRTTLLSWHRRTLELKSARIARDLIEGDDVDARPSHAVVSSNKKKAKKKTKKGVVAQQRNPSTALPSAEDQDASFVCSLSARNLHELNAGGCEGTTPVDVAASSVATALACVVCFYAEASHAVVPCGHRCLCAACAELLLQNAGAFCPVCRADAIMAIRIFG